MVKMYRSVLQLAVLAQETGIVWFSSLLPHLQCLLKEQQFLQEMVPSLPLHDTLGFVGLTQYWLYAEGL